MRRGGHRDGAAGRTQGGRAREIRQAAARRLIWRKGEHAPARYGLHLKLRFSKGRKTASNPIESVTEMSIAPIRQPWCNPARNSRL